MNEEQKNIETCLAENILSEVANVPTDPQFRSLTDEALDPLKQQALQQAGYDGYKEVVMYHKPYTFTSQVKQMKSNLILLLRRLWRFPFGRGTTASAAAGSSATSSADGSSASAAAPIRSLADMWQHYITRLKGNPEYGIPSRLDQLADLPDAPALLANRTIGGAIGASDGISIAHLLCDSTAASAVTELTDDNEYVLDKSLNCSSPIFANLERIQIGCKNNTQPILYVSGYNAVMSKLTSIDLPNLVVGCNLIHPYANTSGAFHPGFDNVTSLTIPKLKEIRQISGWALFYQAFIGRQLPALEVLELPELEIVNNYFFGGNSLSGIKTLRIPKMKACNYPFCNTYQSTNGCPDLLLFEIGPMTTSLNISFWTAANVLQNNLQQFLSNFKTYIALRLTDNGSGKTLTLSQAVRNAIHAAEDEYGIENIIITQKGWTISPAPN